MTPRSHHIARLFGGILLFFPLASTALKRPPNAVHNEFNCQIADMSGRVLRVFPGERCTYLPDGRFIESTQRKLALYDKNNLLVWKKSLHAHHQTKLMADGRSILLLNSSIHDDRGEPTRFDRISVFDLDGNEMRAFDFFEHRTELVRRAADSFKDIRGETIPDFRIPPADLSEQEKKDFKPVKWEFSHANSVQEIPESILSKKNSAFKKGNILVNISGLFIMIILDPKLAKILWSMQIEPSTNSLVPSIHDAQMQANGKILIYNNFYAQDVSVIEEIDPLTRKRKLLYKASPPESFFGMAQGGVQKLRGGNLLISEISGKRPARIFEIDAKGKTVWTIPASAAGPGTDPVTGLQEAHRLDLSEFLKNNKSL